MTTTRETSPTHRPRYRHIAARQRPDPMQAIMDAEVRAAVTLACSWCFEVALHAGIHGTPLPAGCDGCGRDGAAIAVVADDVRRAWWGEGGTR